MVARDPFDGHRRVYIFVAILVTLAVAGALAIGLGVGLGQRDEHCSSCVTPEDQSTDFVVTECGPVKGVIDLPTSATVFKGIPFAAPPVGVRRWSAPVSLKDAGMCWAGTLVADTFGSRCPQFAPGLPFDSTGNEDCLFLNVYQPRGSNSSSNLPVMFFIHGGSAMWFWSDVYDWSKFARDTNTIVVTMNYRLHVLGFLALEELSARSPTGVSGNYGVQDLQLALRWVQGNIGKFGGNPNLVTISGQSSGGTLCLALLSSPASQGLFSRVISMSASPNNTMSLANAQRFNRDFVNKSGCHLQPNVTECLFNLTTSQVRDAVPDWYYVPSQSWCCGIPEEAPPGPQWPGLIIVDGVTVVTSTIQALSTPVIDVPLMIGNVAQEGDFAPADDYTGLTLSEVQSRISTNLAAWHNATVVNALFDTYEAEFAINPQRGFVTLSADLTVVCGNLVLAEAAANAFQSPVYSFVVTQGPAHSQYVFFPGYNTTNAYHMFDLLAAIENWDAASQFADNPNYDPEPADLAFAAFLRSVWLEFMTNGRVAGWRSVRPHVGATWVGLLNGTITNAPAYKNSTCHLFRDLGFDERYWWSS